MKDDEKKIMCVCGFEFAESGKFCPECGTPLAKIKEAGQSSTVHTAPAEHPFPMEYPPCGIMCGAAGTAPSEAEEPTRTPPDDKELKLLVDCCQKTLATGCGDSSDETVLYLDEKSGEYQIHTYYRGFGSLKEKHRGYKTDKSACEKVYQLILESGLTACSENSFAGMTGGEYVCKFVYENKVYRLTTANVPYHDVKKLYAVGALLNSFIEKENEIFGDKNE